MTLRRYESSQSQHTRAVSALGGVRIAERAEQLRARGIAPARVAELLEEPAAELAAYYALQGRDGRRRMSWADGPLLSGLVNPAVPIPPSAQAVQGISGADVLGAAP